MLRAIAIALIPTAVLAQAPKVLVVSFTGVAEQSTSRVIARRLQTEIGQALTAERRVDTSGGRISGSATASVPAGTVTLLLVTQAMLAGAGPRDPAPVTLIGTAPLALVVSPSLPASSVQELIALARARPLPSGASRTGTPPHLAAGLFASLAGVRLPSELFVNFADARRDKRRILASTGSRRAELAPEVPTMAEAGVPGYEIETWFGAVVPEGMKDFAPLLHEQIARVFAQRIAREELAAEGVRAVLAPPAEFARVIQADRARWEKLLR